MLDRDQPNGAPAEHPAPSPPSPGQTRILTPVDASPVEGRPASAPSRRFRPGMRAAALVSLATLLVVLGAGALLVRNAGREPLFFIATPTSTPPPELSFFPAPPTPDRPQHDRPPPADVLAPALLADYEGRYEDAAALYRDVAQGRAGDEIGAEARWRLGVALYNAGRYDDSVASFRIFAANYVSDTRAVRAAFWAGRGHAAAGRPAEARAEFESYAPNGGPLEPIAWLLAADAAGADGRDDLQRELIERALLSSTNRLDRVLAFERRANLDAAAGRHGAAGAAYLEVAGNSRVPFYRAANLLKAGRAFYSAGDRRQAEEALLTLIRELPDEADAYRGLLLLLEHDRGALDGGKVGYDRACRVALAGGEAEVALNNCETYRRVVGPGPERAEAAWYTARAYERLDNHLEAANWYRAFAETYPADVRAGDALLAWGSMMMELGNPPAAMEAFDRLVATYPTSPLFAQAHDRAAVLLRRGGDLATAGERWRLAANAPTASSEDRARAFFWWGWALQQQGQAENAAQVWRQGAEHSTFWGFRCADHLDAGRLVPVNPGAASPEQLLSQALPAPGSAEEEALYGWLGGWSRTAPGGPAARDELLELPDYQRALALSRAQLWPEANSQYDAMIAEARQAGDGATLAALMLATAGEGWHWVSYRAAHALREAAGSAGASLAPGDLPDALLRGLYPVVWPQALLREARERNLDPYLTLAMIRQESAFEPRAHSWADARGLTQVIPDTASAIASELALDGFQQSHLFRPAVALRFGVFYLDQTLRRFDGNILYALAGYNGGPGNVPRWAGGPATGDLDLFVEDIDYPETREYVQIVYGNYRMYRAIYAEQGLVSVEQ